MCKKSSTVTKSIKSAYKSKWFLSGINKGWSILYFLRDGLFGSGYENPGFSFGFDECKCTFTHKGTIQIVFLYEYLSFYKIKKYMKESLQGTNNLTHNEMLHKSYSYLIPKTPR